MPPLFEEITRSHEVACEFASLCIFTYSFSFVTNSTIRIDSFKTTIE